jgi:hypothetical protein
MINSIAFYCGQHENQYISWVIFKSVWDEFKNKQQALDSFTEFLYSGYVSRDRSYKKNVECPKCGYCEDLNDFNKDEFLSIILNLNTATLNETSFDDFNDNWDIFDFNFDDKFKNMYVIKDLDMPAEMFILNNLYKLHPELKT